MWAMGFTSRRSRFTEHARVGFRAEAPGKVRAKQSEAAVAEALRLALSDECRYRLVLIDRGAEGAVRHVLHPEERDVPADSPLANRPPPPSRSELILVARLSDDCHRGSDRAILETTRIMDHLGVEKLDGLCVPWPEASEDAPHDPNHTGPDCRRQKKLFLRTWKALHKKLVPDRVRWLGTELLDAWQLERVVEDVSEHERPVFNLIEMDISAPKTRTVTWCQAHGIELLGMLDTSEHKISTEEVGKFRELQTEMDVEPSVIITRWAVQRGVVTLPSLSRVVSEGSSLTSAEAYEAWADKLKKILAARTLHLHMPTEGRRVNLDNARLALLNSFDREQNEKQEYYDQRLAEITRRKLKPVRTAAKALNALSAFSTAAEDKARERGEEVPAFTL